MMLRSSSNSSGDSSNLGRCDLRLLNIVLSSVSKVKVVAALWNYDTKLNICHKLSVEISAVRLIKC